MSIVFLTEFDLSKHSGASFNRILELSKILYCATEKDVYVTSFMMDNSKWSVSVLDEQYPIFSLGTFKACNKSFIRKRYFLHAEKYAELHKIISYFNGLKPKPVFIVYNYFSSFYDQFVFTRFLKQRGFKVIAEKNERALGIALIRSYPRGLGRRLLFELFRLLEILNGYLIDSDLKNFDGFLTINENYKRFIVGRISRQPVVKIPILFKKQTTQNRSVNQTLKRLKSSSDVLKIAYFGTININRDKIDVALKAVFLLKNKYGLKNIEFTIGGNASKIAVSKLKWMINKYQLQQIVNYVGYVSNDDLNALLNDQKVLLALRNNNMQGKYSFATKIAMYMHMGKITIVSDASDNSLYITDQENGFILRKNQAEELAEKLYMISMLDERTLFQISSKARSTAHKHFNYKKYIQEVKLLLDDVCISN